MCAIKLTLYSWKPMCQVILNIELDEGRTDCMKKYQIYRSLGNVARDIGKHELIGVEYDEDIHDAQARIIKTIQIDASELPKYKGYEVAVYPPENLDYLKRKTRYAYRAYTVLSNPNAPEGEGIDYGIVETDADLNEKI